MIHSTTQQSENQAYKLLVHTVRFMPYGSVLTLALKESENTDSRLLVVKNIDNNTKYVGLNTWAVGNKPTADSPNPTDTEGVSNRQLPPIHRQFMADIYQYIEANIDNDALSLDDLTREFALSRSQLFRKLKELTNATPAQLIRTYRLDTAYRLLQADKTTRVSEVMFAVGFNDAQHFGQIFKQRFGVSPQEVKR
jgi:AraC-like DNA-binding protein